MSDDKQTQLQDILFKAFQATSSIDDRQRGSSTSGLDIRKPIKPNLAFEDDSKLKSKHIEIKNAFASALWLVDDLMVPWDIILYSGEKSTKWLNTLNDIVNMTLNSNNKDLNVQNISSLAEQTLAFYIPNRDIQNRNSQRLALQNFNDKYYPVLKQTPNNFLKLPGNEILDKELRDILLQGCTMLGRQACAAAYGNAAGVVHHFITKVSEFFLQIEEAESLDAWFNENDDITIIFGEWHQAIATQYSFIESGYAAKIRNFAKEDYLGEAGIDNPFKDIYYQILTNPKLWNYLQRNIFKVFDTTNRFRNALIDYVANNKKDIDDSHIYKMYNATISKEDGSHALFTEYINFAAKSMDITKNTKINNHPISNLARVQDNLSDNITTEILEGGISTIFASLSSFEPSHHTELTKAFMSQSDIKKDSWMAQIFPRPDIALGLLLGGTPHVSSISSLMIARQYMVDNQNVIQENTSFLKDVLLNMDNIDDLYPDRLMNFDKNINYAGFVDGTIYQYHCLNGNTMGGDIKIPFGHLDHAIDDIVSRNMSSNVVSVLQPYIDANKKIKEQAIQHIADARRDVEFAMLIDIKKRSKMSGKLARNGRTTPLNLIDLPLETRNALTKSKHILKLLQLIQLDLTLTGLLTYSIYEETEPISSSSPSTTNNNNINIRNVSANPLDESEIPSKKEEILAKTRAFLVSIGLTVDNSFTTIIDKEYNNNNEDIIGKWLASLQGQLPSYAQVVKSFTLEARAKGFNLPSIGTIKSAADDFKTAGIYDPDLDFAIAELIAFAARFNYQVAPDNADAVYTLERASLVSESKRLLWALNITSRQKSVGLLISRLSTLYLHTECKIMYDTIASCAVDSIGVSGGVNEYLRSLVGLKTKSSLETEIIGNAKVDGVTIVHENIYKKLTTDDNFISNFIKPVGDGAYKISLKIENLENALTSLPNGLSSIGLSDVGPGAIRLDDNGDTVIMRMLKEHISATFGLIKKQIEDLQKNMSIDNIKNPPSQDNMIKLFKNAVLNVTPDTFLHTSVGNHDVWQSFLAEKTILDLAKGNLFSDSNFTVTREEVEHALTSVYGNDTATLKNVANRIIEKAGSRPVLVFIKGQTTQIAQITSVDWTADASKYSSEGYDLLNLIAPSTSKIRERTVPEILYALSDTTTKLGSSLYGFSIKALEALKWKDLISAKIGELAGKGLETWFSKSINTLSPLLGFGILLGSLGAQGAFIKYANSSVPPGTRKFTTRMLETTQIESGAQSLVTNFAKGLIQSMQRKLLFGGIAVLGELALSYSGLPINNGILSIGGFISNILMFLFLIFITHQYYKIKNKYSDAKVNVSITRLLTPILPSWQKKVKTILPSQNPEQDPNLRKQISILEDVVK